MAVVVTAEFFIKPELIDDALTLLAEVLPDTRGFEGVRRSRPSSTSMILSTSLVVERWTSRDAHVASLAWRVDSGSANGSVDMMGAVPVFR